MSSLVREPCGHAGVPVSHAYTLSGRFQGAGQDLSIGDAKLYRPGSSRTQNTLNDFIELEGKKICPSKLPVNA